MPDDNTAASNLYLARRLETAAASAVNGLEEQYRSGVARPTISLGSTGLSDSDRLTFNNNGIRVCRFQDRTILQLIARTADQKIMAMVEAHSSDPASDRPATSAIRQLRTGALLWQEHDRRGYQFPHAYVTASDIDEQPFALVRNDDTELSTWRLRRRHAPGVAIEYPSFDEAILDVGRGVDVSVAAERAGRLRTFETTLTVDDLRWAADTQRHLNGRSTDPGIGI
ncbi:hypothetical protein [Mycolicibacterium sphagni]|uniref:Uncharacterized protein n=1 Tax=Mycolicibacterium sphagni TaxID=1786 RepID=A0ABX2K4E3_9MYCO|nr:hypothetical protein [Mycolicibacterium sphagni]NTY62585.1 hypothetical protein [Mycolicibacterium sphagni]